MTNLEIKASPVFEKNWDAINNSDKRYILNQGGSRSSKTYSIIQCLITLSISQKCSISIVRQSFPSLRGSAMRDFFNLLKDYNLYNEDNHQKTENYYQFPNGSIVEFFSTDSDMKIRGRKRDYLYINETNEISFEIYNQLALRTSKKILMDFNPSEPESWVYKLVDDPKSILIKSTYKDNPFLGREQIEYIENLINVDQNYYKIYCLGEPPIANSRVYTHFKQFIDYPNDIIETIYGADWGFTHPTTLIKVDITKGGRFYITELLYENKLTSTDIVSRFNNLISNRQSPIYCDYARPEIIEELKRSGFNVKEANKSVQSGIDLVKKSEIYIHHESTNALREFRLYSYKTVGEKILEEVVKLNDDICDSIRYAIFTHKKKQPNYDYLKFY